MKAEQRVGLRDEFRLERRELCDALLERVRG